MDPSEAIPVLMGFAGIPDADTARRFLERAGGDINVAASLYVDSTAGNDRGSTPGEPVEELRAPDPEYSQTLLSEFLALHFTKEAWAEAPAAARELARAQKKWLLVSIQQVDAFESLRLNRDIWKAEVVQDLIKDFFIFWQRTDKCEEGQIFLDVYRVTSLPHVCAIDPLTGRCLKIWSPRVLSDAIAVQSEFFEFVERQQMAERSRNPDPKPSEGPAEVSSSKKPSAASAACVASADAPGSSSSKAAAAAASAAAAAAADGGKGRTAGEPLGSQSCESQPSAYKDVNLQLQDLMKLREQRRQRQMNSSPST
ncbi:hypothetical protein, conserved [Eimeria necatrix]|uniref:UBX domain-containing protein n=1 Tax=Eimeria necatrix TaxID=51315 RepID=U6MDI4_9EIME|nr:hypothetical protein, conserved [Eimeria necatrix]CDJ62056.1 hypothetical protein, conserved [Eimeria necatrix]